MWNSGSTQMTRSPPSLRVRVARLQISMIETAEVRLPWVSIAPLGRPVVPPVYCKSAMSSGEMAGHTAGATAPSTKARCVITAGLSGNAVCGVPTWPQ